MEYKKAEIREYIQERLNEAYEYDKDYLNQDTYDIHNDLFNTDYYIIGYYKAEKWLGNKTFDIIRYIKDYENEIFGEVHTDLSSSESVVNMYVYIIGEELLEEEIKEFKRDVLLNLMDKYQGHKITDTKIVNDLWKDIIGFDRFDSV